MSEYGDDARDPVPLPADERAGTGSRVRAAMGSAEGLSVAGLLIAALSLSTSLAPQLFAWVALNVRGIDGQGLTLAGLRAAGHGIFAVLAVVLAVMAIARTDVYSPSWIRGVAGGAALVGLIGVAVAVIAAVPAVAGLMLRP